MIDFERIDEVFSDPEVQTSAMDFFFKKIYPEIYRNYNKLNQSFIKFPVVIDCKADSEGRVSNFKLYSKLLYWKILGKIITFYKYGIDMLERLFFLNFTYHKNEQNKPAILAKTIWTFSLLCLLIYFLQKFSIHLEDNFSFLFKKIPNKNPSIDGRALLAGLALFFALYWNFRSIYVSKWTYLVTLYNKVGLDKIDKNYSLAQIYYGWGLFAMDCIKLKFFRHDSFEGAIYDYTFISECFLQYQSTVVEKRKVQLTISEIDDVILRSIKLMNRKYNCCVIIKSNLETDMYRLHSAIEFYLQLKR